TGCASGSTETCREALHLLPAPDVEVPERRLALAHGSKAFGELSCLRPLRVLHGRLVRREFHDLQIGPGAVLVLRQRRPRGGPPARRRLQPLVDEGIELVDPVGLELDQLHERHGRTSAWTRSQPALQATPDAWDVPGSTNEMEGTNSEGFPFTTRPPRRWGWCPEWRSRTFAPVRRARSPPAAGDRARAATPAPLPSSA